MNGYINPADELFPAQVEIIEELAVSGLQKVERERAKLLRPDGSPMFAPAEHADRVKALEEEAAAAFDRSTERYLSLAASEREKAEAELAKLEGADGWEALTESERQAAATRREFVREDVERLPPAEIERRARAALAAKDRAAVWLFARYIRPQVEAGRGSDLAGILRALEAAFGDPSERHQRRRELERRIEATKSLRGRVESGRRRVNGSEARALESMRRTMLARW